MPLASQELPKSRLGRRAPGLRGPAQTADPSRAAAPGERRGFPPSPRVCTSAARLRGQLAVDTCGPVFLWLRMSSLLSQALALQPWGLENLNWPKEGCR